LCLLTEACSHFSVAKQGLIFSWFQITINICSVKHINSLCSVAMMQLGRNSYSCFANFAALSFATLKCERDFTVVCNQFKRRNCIIVPAVLHSKFSLKIQKNLLPTANNYHIINLFLHLQMATLNIFIRKYAVVKCTRYTYYMI